MTKRKASEITETKVKIDLPNEIWNYIMEYAQFSQHERERVMPIYYDKPLLSKAQWHAMYYVYANKHKQYNIAQ